LAVVLLPSVVTGVTTILFSTPSLHREIVASNQLFTEVLN